MGLAPIYKPGAETTCPAPYRCCATSLLAYQPDRRAKKGDYREAESKGFAVICYPYFVVKVNLLSGTGLHASTAAFVLRTLLVHTLSLYCVN